ncbi:MAG: hypothetical protein WBC91_20325 [Phototrophicaceae bacterium]
MMDDPMMMFVIAIVVLVVIYILMKNMRNNTNNTQDNRDYRTQGSERPRHDDPNIAGSGTFGTRQSREELDWLRSSQKRTEPPVVREVSRDVRNVDSSEIDGRGAFGRDKK